MTHAQRNAEIMRLIRAHTVAATSSRKVARTTLIEEGIYTKKGTLRAQFGGGKKAVAAD